MKKVSARALFTILWRGLYQAQKWVFGLFGYKGDGKFAKCLWRLFETSAAIIVVTIAVVLVWATGKELYREYNRRYHNYDDPCWHKRVYVGRNIYYHSHGDGDGYVYNIQTGKKYLKNVAWIAKPMGKDSLVCFSDGKKRGYFSKNTGKVVIEPKYSHAWIFSDGLASVEEDGYIKFIDATGKMVIDKKIPYIPNKKGYMFHGGYCVVDTEDGEKCGLMDKAGNIVLPMEYSSIYPTNDFELWLVKKGKESAVIDRDLKPIIPQMECSIYINDGTIDVTMPDHTMRKYDLQGTLINDFYIFSVRALEYEKDEILYRRETHDGESNEYDVPVVEPYHPMATARLRAYVAGKGYEGLMTADGHIVTMPLYKDIDAIGNDLYLCTFTNHDKVIVNGKGEIVR